MSTNYFNRTGGANDGMPGAGLEQIAETLENDFGLNGSISQEDLSAGVSAARSLNNIIAEAMRATNAGAVGYFTVDDVVAMNTWIQNNRLDTWNQSYGSDANGVQTGYQLLLNEGAASQYRGESLADTVANGIYQLGFTIADGRVVDGSGNPGATLQQMADWLTQFSTDKSTTGTPLDRLSDMVMADSGLAQNVPDGDVLVGADFTNAMSDYIKDAIQMTGVAADNRIDAGDVAEINSYLYDVYRYDWPELHGSSAYGEETAFHLVHNDGATTRIFGENFVDTVLEGITNLGFQMTNGTVTDETGQPGASADQLADWLNYFYVDQSTTNTGLDYLVDAIKSDKGLAENTSAADINAGAEAANRMNQIIVEAIQQLRPAGAADQTPFTEEDVRLINAYIRDNRLAEWTGLHGNDENGQETGFHLVHGDGGTLKFGGDDLINTVAEGLYNLGSTIDGDHVLDEDGNQNASLSNIATWLNNFYLGTDVTTNPRNENPDPTQTDPDPTQTNPDPTQTNPDPSQTNPDPTQANPDPNQTNPDPTQTKEGSTQDPDKKVEDKVEPGLTLVGGRGRDHLRGHKLNDEIDGGGGSDRLFGGEGDDQIRGGTGNDRLYGEGGSDTLSGGKGNDNLYGGANADTLNGDEGRDNLRGGAGEDTLNGGSGNDKLKGGDDGDT